MYSFPLCNLSNIFLYKVLKNNKNHNFLIVGISMIKGRMDYLSSPLFINSQLGLGDFVKKINELKCIIFFEVSKDWRPKKREVQ